MCFHWKSLRRQVRVSGLVEQVSDKEADDYFNSRPYKNKIGAWAPSQSEVMQKRETFILKIKEFEKNIQIMSRYLDRRIGQVGEFCPMRLNFG